MFVASISMSPSFTEAGSFLNSPRSKQLIILRITAFKKYFPFHTGWDVTDRMLVFRLEQFFVTVFANIGCKSELETQTPLEENMGGKKVSKAVERSRLAATTDQRALAPR